jgi:hypothetical protein
MSHAAVYLYDAGDFALLCLCNHSSDYRGAAHFVGQSGRLVSYVPRDGKLCIFGGEMHSVDLFGPALLLRLQTLVSRVPPHLLLLSNSTSTEGPSRYGHPAPWCCARRQGPEFGYRTGSGCDLVLSQDD